MFRSGMSVLRFRKRANRCIDADHVRRPGSDAATSAQCIHPRILHQADIFPVQQCALSQHVPRVQRPAKLLLAHHIDSGWRTLFSVGEVRDTHKHTHTAHTTQTTHTRSTHSLSCGLFDATNIVANIALRVLICCVPARFSMLVAAMSHDAAHDGIGSSFHVGVSSPYATTYNDISPLENTHAWNCFDAMRADGCNVLGSFDRSDRVQLRNIDNSVEIIEYRQHYYRHRYHLPYSARRRPWCALPES